jgi:DNA-binding MarR family transcriptional regulator
MAGSTETCNDAIQSEIVSTLDAALSSFVQQGMQGRMQLAVATSSRIGLPLTAAALALLDALSTKPMRPTELAAFVGIKPSSLTKQIQELEAKGLVDRATDEQDGRAAIIRLTQAGRDSLAAAAEIRQSILCQVTKGWSVGQIEEVIELLDRLSEGVRAGWNDFFVSRSQRRVVLEGDAEVIAKDDDIRKVYLGG